jgi:hypothetical protein
VFGGGMGVFGQRSHSAKLLRRPHREKPFFASPGLTAVRMLVGRIPPLGRDEPHIPRVQSGSTDASSHREPKDR